MILFEVIVLAQNILDVTTDSGGLIVERRCAQRTSTGLKVKLEHPLYSTIVCHIRDICDDGLFLEYEFTEGFCCGSTVDIRFFLSSDVETGMQQKMKIIRIQEDGLGLKFLETAVCSWPKPQDSPVYCE